MAVINKTLRREEGLVWGDGVKDSSLYFNDHGIILDALGRDAGKAAFLIRGLNTANAPLELFRVNKDGSVSFAGGFTVTGQLALPTQGSSGGLLIGGDALLYRSAADTLATGTGDGLVVAQGLTVTAGSLTFGAAAATIVPGATSFALRDTADARDNLFVGNGGFLGVNDNANAKMTIGVTINQAGNDDEIVALKSSDVAHGMTVLAETDTYGSLAKNSAASGGLLIRGLTSAGDQGIVLQGLVAGQDTTKSTAGTGAVQVLGALKSGTTVTDLQTNVNILAVRNNGTTRFIFDADGDSHQDVGTAWTNFDEYDDPALLTALSVGVSRDGDPIRERFGRVLAEHRDALERARLVTFNPDGHHFVNMSRLTMALVGAVRQQAARIDALESRLALVGG